MRMRWVAVLASVGLLAACSGNPEGPSDSGGSGGGGGGQTLTCPTFVGTSSVRAQGTMTATINGVAWTANCIAVHNTDPSIISLVGADLQSGTNFQTFGFAGNRVAGTQTITALSVLNATLVQGLNGWNANLAQGSGTVTLTTATNNSAAGTFTFSLLPTPGNPATGTKVVTGSLNITF